MFNRIQKCFFYCKSVKKNCSLKLLCLQWIPFANDNGLFFWLLVFIRFQFFFIRLLFIIFQCVSLSFALKFFSSMFIFFLKFILSLGVLLYPAVGIFFSLYALSFHSTLSILSDDMWSFFNWHFFLFLLFFLPFEITFVFVQISHAWNFLDIKIVPKFKKKSIAANPYINILQFGSLNVQILHKGTYVSHTFDNFHFQHKMKLKCFSKTLIQFVKMFDFEIRV